MLKTGAVITPLSIIQNPKGDIYHGLKANEMSFKGFGEAYFSTILTNVVKGWKFHKLMTLNLIVPVGKVQFYLISENEKIYETLTLGKEMYYRLSVPPRVWVAFKGLGNNTNLLLNIASITHNPEEALTKPLEDFPLNNFESVTNFN